MRSLRAGARPAPAEVRAWFAPMLALDQATLAAHMATLEADPNWILFTRQLVDQLEIEAHYTPVGEVLWLRFERLANPDSPLWRRVR